VRIAIVGGGITGLSAAYEIAPRAQVTLYEQSGRLGGRIETVDFAGARLDTGPDSFITRRPAALELCEQLGLGADLVGPAVSGALVYSRGALRRLPERSVLGVPTNLRALARSHALSWRGVLRVTAEPLLPGSHRRGDDGDPSVAEVLRPRLGAEAMAVLVDPLIGGINAGTSANLSLRAVVPQISAAIEGKRSVVRALRAQAAAPSAPASASDSASSPGGKHERPVFAGIAGGLGRLVEALHGHLVAAGVQFELGNTVSGLRASEGDGQGRYDLVHERGTDSVDGVVLCLPAPAAARLLGEVAAPAVAGLASVRSASVALVTASYEEFRLPEGGTGILVPRPYRETITAVTFTSAKWPAGAPDGRVLVRASVGSIDDDSHVDLDDHDLVEKVLADLERVAGITAKPEDILVKRFPQSFPQYEPGHLGRVADMRARLRVARGGGVAIAGAPYDGIGIPACVESGRREAAALVAGLTAQRPTSIVKGCPTRHVG
jgi:protoporphyrinogen/coproporphyrinogen III oxidase